MRPFLFRVGAAVACAGLLALAPPLGGVENYPNRPIRLVVPFPAGGSTDGLARLVMPKVAEALGQQIVIDNRGGAGGSIGTGLVAKAQPDGYTLLMVFDTHAVNPSIYKNLPFDTFKQLTAVSLMVISPLYVLAHPSLAAENVNQLIRLAKSKPGALNYGSPGPGSSNHLSTELFKQVAGVDIVHIPYKGGGPAQLALIGGEVQMMFTSSSLAVPLVKGGRVKALGVCSPKRSAALPEVPTLAEQGLAGLEMSAWFGLLAPAGTPTNVVSRWNQEVAEALHHPQIAPRLAEQGLNVVASSPADFDRFIRTEAARWSKLIKQRNISVE